MPHSVRQQPTNRKTSPILPGAIDSIHKKNPIVWFGYLVNIQRLAAVVSADKGYGFTLYRPVLDSRAPIEKASMRAKALPCVF